MALGAALTTAGRPTGSGGVRPFQLTREDKDMRIWGVAYEFDENGDPIARFVEESDDEQDARAWAQSSGDPSARVVYRTSAPGYGPWTVA